LLVDGHSCLLTSQLDISDCRFIRFLYTSGTTISSTEPPQPSRPLHFDLRALLHVLYPIDYQPVDTITPTFDTTAIILSTITRLEYFLTDHEVRQLLNTNQTFYGKLLPYYQHRYQEVHCEHYHYPHDNDYDSDNEYYDTFFPHFHGTIDFNDPDIVELLTLQATQQQPFTNYNAEQAITTVQATLVPHLTDYSYLQLFATNRNIHKAIKTFNDNRYLNFALGCCPEYEPDSDYHSED
jgi:hypothetical protein